MSKQDPPKAVRIDNWNYQGNWSRQRSGVPLLGIFLIAFGLFLAADQLFREARIGASAFFLALGAALIIKGLRDHSDVSLYVGIFVAALALSDLLSGIGLIHGGGWGTLFLGIGVIAIALLRSTSGRHWGWAFAIGVLLALWGGSEVAAANLNFPADRLVGPLLLVLLGVYIVSRRTGDNG